MKLTKTLPTHAVVDIRRRKSNGHIIQMQVILLPTKADAHKRANHIRKVGLVKRGESRYVHVRRVTY